MNEILYTLTLRLCLVVIWCLTCDGCDCAYNISKVFPPFHNFAFKKKHLNFLEKNIVLYKVN